MKRTISYTDARGRLHATPEPATVSEICDLLGGDAEKEGLAYGIAKEILAKRTELERLFREHDEAIQAG